MAIITTVIGNVTKDPELRFGQSGKAWMSGSVAVNNRVPDGQGGWKDGEPTYVDFKIFGAAAENFDRSVRKGTRVILHGELKQDSWEDRESGQKRTRMVLTVEEAGVSMRWATISGIERSSGGNGGGMSSAPARAAEPQSGGFEDLHDSNPFM